jgi:hypothetical protein
LSKLKRSEKWHCYIKELTVVEARAQWFRLSLVVRLVTRFQSCALQYTAMLGFERNDRRVTYGRVKNSTTRHREAILAIRMPFHYSRQRNLIIYTSNANDYK